MKKLIVLILMVIMCLNGCNDLAQTDTGTENSQKNTEDTQKDTQESYREVVFLNKLPPMIRDEVVHNNEFISQYEEGADKEQLYAFLVNLDHYELVEGKMVERDTKRDTQKAVDLMRKAGLMILPDYPLCAYNNDKAKDKPESLDEQTYGLCAVVGTLEEIKRVFDGTEPMEDGYYYVWSAPRPDFMEKVKEAGYNRDVGDLPFYLATDDDYMLPYVGDENQVIMKVRVE